MFRVKVSVNTCFSWNRKKKKVLEIIKDCLLLKYQRFSRLYLKLFQRGLKNPWTLLTVTSLKMFDRVLYESLKSVSANGNHVFLFHLSELQKS